MPNFHVSLIIAGMMIANTDTVHYLDFSDKVYRFFPTLLLPEDAARYHGDNERIGVADYKRVIDFYFRLMLNADLVFDLAPGDQARDHREL
jgi:carboxypeptidase PM20D1